ncbi:MAG: hypothetical protein ACI808_000419 [Paraglaciecola sp.]|jgi:hypothetical protein
MLTGYLSFTVGLEHRTEKGNFYSDTIASNGDLEPTISFVFYTVLSNLTLNGIIY